MIFYSAICILLPCIMGGLRATSVGIDVMTYAAPQYHVASIAPSFSSFLRISGRMSREIGWAAVTYFSTKIFGSLNWNLFFYQLITLTCTYIALYKHRKYAPLFFLWLTFLLGTYYTTYNVMRQAIAASIIFMGIDSLEKKKYAKFMVYVVFAATFHSSAVIVVSYFVMFHMLLTWKPRYTWAKTAMLAGIFLLLVAARPIIGIVTRSIPFLGTYSGYENNNYSPFRNLGLNIMLFGELLACTLYYNGMKRVFADGEMYKLFTYNLAFQLVYTVFVRVFYIRVFYYLSFINVMLIAAVPFFIKEKTLRNLAFVSVFLVSAVFFYMVNAVKNSAGTWPYVSIL
ncbi:MAG: EpsG family protein [Synergistaceae bacterium]|nr:EpsG family protein [Synergistaceae bacterium]